MLSNFQQFSCSAHRGQHSHIQASCPEFIKNRDEEGRKKIASELTVKQTTQHSTPKAVTLLKQSSSGMYNCCKTVQQMIITKETPLQPKMIQLIRVHSTCCKALQLNCMLEV